jgi:hypothetical protein
LSEARHKYDLDATSLDVASWSWVSRFIRKNEQVEGLTLLRNAIAVSGSGPNCQQADYEHDDSEEDVDEDFWSHAQNLVRSFSPFEGLDRADWKVLEVIGVKVQ